MVVHRQFSEWLTPAAPAVKQSVLTRHVSTATPEARSIAEFRHAPTISAPLVKALVRPSPSAVTPHLVWFATAPSRPGPAVRPSH